MAISKNQAHDLLVNSITKCIDENIRAIAVNGRQYTTLSSTRWPTNILEQILEEYKKTGFEVDTSVAGYIRLSW